MGWVIKPFFLVLQQRRLRKVFVYFDGTNLDFHAGVLSGVQVLDTEVDFVFEYFILAEEFLGEELFIFSGGVLVLSPLPSAVLGGFLFLFA